MNISIDIDGVLASFNSAVIKIANQKMGKSLPPDYEPPDWYYSDIFSKDDLKTLFDHIKGIENFWINLPPYEDQIKALRQWQQMNEWMYKEPPVKVHYITARASGNDPLLQSEIWLAGFGLHGTVHWVDTPDKKLALMRDLVIRFSIDDYAPTVEQCNTIPGHRAFLQDRPWNQYSSEPRVKSIRDFLWAVQRYSME